MKNSKVEWNEPTDFPEELNKAHNNFTVDVLVYSKKTNEHTIGWFDFKEMKWHFLCREAQKNFKWRYLDDQVDKPNQNNV